MNIPCFYIGIKRARLKISRPVNHTRGPVVARRGLRVSSVTAVAARKTIDAGSEGVAQLAFRGCGASHARISELTPC